MSQESLIPPSLPLATSDRDVGYLILDTGRELVRPAVLASARELADEGAALPPWIDGIVAALASEVGSRAARAMVIELNLARVGGRLPAGDDSAQYRAFIAGVASGPYRDYIAAKYPVLLEMVNRRADGAVRAAHELVARLRSDADALTELFGPFEAEVAQITLAGDSHLDGHQTSIVEMIDGRRLVYKPRPGILDQFYKVVTTEINENLRFPLSTALSLHRGEYSWQEFVESVHEQRPGDLHRLGSWLAVAYYTALQDIHHENVVWSQRGPMIVDFECGLNAEVLPLRQTLIGGTERPSHVGDTGILPGQTARRGDGRAANWGVVGYEEADSFVGSAQIVENDGTPLAHLVTQTDRNQLLSTPEWLDQAAPASAVDWSDRDGVTNELINGFVEARMALLGATEIILKTVEELAPETRIVLRPTSLYGDVLRKASYPRYLVSHESFSQAVASWLSSELDVPLNSEVSSLAHMDIPYFRVSVFDDAFVGPEGKLTLRSGFERLKVLLKSLSDEGDLVRQLAVIRKTLATLYGVRIPATRESPREASETEAREILTLVMQSVVQAGFTGKTGTSWVNLSIGVEQDLMVTSSQPDLFQGFVGTALALSACARAGLEVDGADDAIGAIVAEASRAILERDGLNDPGVFSGIGGLAYFLACVRKMSPALVPHSSIVDEGLKWIIDEFPRVWGHDVISGAAGLLALAVRLRASGSCDPLLATQVQKLALQNLDNTKIETDLGVAWPDLTNASEWLGGFSHGVAGVAWATSLADGELAHKLRKSAWNTQIGLRSPSQGFHWDDRREDARLRGDSIVAWCHGGDGIILAAAEGAGTFEKREVTDYDILESWIATPCQPDTAICHGRAGRLAILSRLARHPRHRKMTRQSYELIENARISLRREVVEDLRCAPTEQDAMISLHDGLMIGRAGTALGLMIDMCGQRVPNPLCLDIPH